MLVDTLQHLLPEFSQDTIQQLVDLAQPRSVARNAYWHRAGQPTTYLVFCQVGMLAVVYPMETREVVKQFVVEGEFVPTVVGLLTQQPTLVSIKAVEDSKLLVWEAAAVGELIRQNPALHLFIDRLIGANYCFKERRETMLLTEPPKQYYLYLLDHCPFIIADRVPLHYLASYIGVTPETLSRIRSRRIGKSIAR